MTGGVFVETQSDSLGNRLDLDQRTGGYFLPTLSHRLLWVAEVYSSKHFRRRDSVERI